MALDLSTADVYEQASVIGQDIEKIIDQYGHEAVLDLMPKVVRVLEELEILVSERENEKLEFAELKMENERLYLEIKKEASQRRKLDEELYSTQIDGEANNLKTMVAKLKEENKKLRMEYQASMNEKLTTYVSAPGDAEVMRRMKETIDSQREAIRLRNTEIDNQRSDIDAMEEQIDRLTNINESLRRNLSAKQTRIRMLAKEKAELQAEFKAFKLDLGKENIGLSESEELTGDIHDSYEQEDDGNELTELHQRNNSHKEEENNNGTHEKVASEVHEWEILENGENEEKVEWEEGRMDKSAPLDPNRPRYTKAELQEILNERNQLKEEVFFLKDELAYYRPKNEDEEQTPTAKSPKTSKKPSRREESGISKIFSIFNRK
ncbi:RILP-like protein 1 isoform X2 [Nematostella vectensis]|uniref:RILP-like protein 1 isoform X2 n=1 Tax=Nematostella vectensis TaxID=45351 RepID=UPI00139044FC|nr:RILP-like protein 1 isoform X2 [Nematostella vectensis]